MFLNSIYFSCVKSCLQQRPFINLLLGTSVKRNICSAALNKDVKSMFGVKPVTLITVRTTQRGQNYRPNLYRRQKKHGWDKRMSTTNGKMTIIRRMIKGVSRRRLTV